MITICEKKKKTLVRFEKWLKNVWVTCTRFNHNFPDFEIRCVRITYRTIRLHGVQYYINDVNAWVVARIFVRRSDEFARFVSNVSVLFFRRPTFDDGLSIALYKTRKM